jgi:hypothetical protein
MDSLCSDQFATVVSAPHYMSPRFCAGGSQKAHIFVLERGLEQLMSLRRSVNHVVA